MQPLLPENLSRNGTGATNPAQATDKGLSGRLNTTCVFPRPAIGAGRRPMHKASPFPSAVLFANLLSLVCGFSCVDRSSL
jgi:hypothetical protein